MELSRKSLAISSAASFMFLSGCGGDSGGISMLPLAPQTPTPTPAPTPTHTASISAPARASTAPGAAPVLATPAGPNFTTGPAPGTIFPLLQSAMVFDASGAKPEAIPSAAGGAATVQAGILNVSVPAWQGYANLDWTRVGYWDTGGGWWDYDDTVGRHGAFVTGYETPTAAIPTTGTATYTGLAQGVVFFPGVSSGTTHCACNIVTLTGNAAFTANFGTRNVSGSLTGMMAGSSAWNDVAFNSTLAGNAFSGTTSVTSTPSGPGSMLGNATGTIEGKFFGPGAQEAGALWSLFDGTNAAMGTLTGKHP